MKQAKKSGGFSYVEVILAAVLISITVVAVWPMLSQARRNMAFSQYQYAANLHAQSIVIIIRDAMADNMPPQPQVHSFAAQQGGLLFSFWITGAYNVTYHSGVSPHADVNVNGMWPDTSTIVAVIWDENGQIIGRAVGAL